MISVTKWFWDKWQGMLLTRYMLLVFQTFCSICNTCKLQTQHLVAFATFLCCICDMLHMRHLRVAYATKCCVCDISLLHMQQNVAYATNFHKKGFFSISALGNIFYCSDLDSWAGGPYQTEKKLGVIWKLSWWFPGSTVGRVQRKNGKKERRFSLLLFKYEKGRNF